VSETTVAVNCGAAKYAHLHQTASPYVAVALSMWAYSMSSPRGPGHMEIRGGADANTDKVLLCLPPDAARDLARMILAATEPADTPALSEVA
jgi:hypothetical protein